MNDELLAMLGKDFVDNVTGFYGTCTGLAIYTTGTPRVFLESLDEVRRPVSLWFDVDRLRPA